MSHLVLVDGNNLGFSAMGSPKLFAGDKGTQATFTVIKSIRKLFIDNPQAYIMVLWDGRSWRKDAFKDYKANREVTTKQVEARQEYYEQKAGIVDALRMLGITQCFAANMEADDLAEIYARKWKGDKVTLISGDKDWLQLVDERVTWVDPIHNRQCTYKNFSAFTGCKDVAQFLETKYVLGDAGDNIKGLHKVGPKTLEKLFDIWDSVNQFVCDDDKREKWKEVHGQNLPAALDVSCHDISHVMSINEILMNLRTISRPEPRNLVQDRQDLDSESFKAFCYENAFLSFLKDYDRFLQPIRDNKYVRIRKAC